MHRQLAIVVMNYGGRLAYARDSQLVSVPVFQEIFSMVTCGARNRKRVIYARFFFFLRPVSVAVRRDGLVRCIGRISV